MPSHRSLSIIVLVLLGASFAGANLRFTAARSTIPLDLHGEVVWKQRLMEKTPGVDDVYLVTLDSNRRIQVDGPVFDALVLNRSIDKCAWSRTLESDGRMIEIVWSPDFHGMAWAMPLTVVLVLLHGFLAILTALTNADEPDDAREWPIAAESDG